MNPSLQNIAIRTAKKSRFNVFRHGAAIAKSGRVFSKGVNTPKPRTPNSSFSTHAEMFALKRLATVLARQNKTDSFELYVARVNPSNCTALSRPCDKCMAALKESGVIDIIHYTTDTGWESVEI